MINPLRGGGPSARDTPVFTIGCAQLVANHDFDMTAALTQMPFAGHIHQAV
jgi:hypothetical protein